MSSSSVFISQEMAELRKAKEMNDRLDLEIRALRNRVRCLDAEKSSLQQTVRYLLEYNFTNIDVKQSKHYAEVTHRNNFTHYFAAKIFKFEK